MPVQAVKVSDLHAGLGKTKTNNNNEKNFPLSWDETVQILLEQDL